MWLPGLHEALAYTPGFTYLAWLYTPVFPAPGKRRLRHQSFTVILLSCAGEFETRLDCVRAYLKTQTLTHNILSCTLSSGSVMNRCCARCVPRAGVFRCPRPLCQERWC